jgi:hypothetical protein
LKIKLKLRKITNMFFLQKQTKKKGASLNLSATGNPAEGDRPQKRTRSASRLGPLLRLQHLAEHIEQPRKLKEQRRWLDNNCGVVRKVGLKEQWKFTHGTIKKKKKKKKKNSAARCHATSLPRRPSSCATVIAVHRATTPAIAPLSAARTASGAIGPGLVSTVGFLRRPVTPLCEARGTSSCRTRSRSTGDESSAGGPTRTGQFQVGDAAAQRLFWGYFLIKNRKYI